MHVTRRDDDHRFVEQLHAPRRLVQRERGLTATEQGEREQAVVVAALRLHEDSVGQPARGLRVAGAQRDEEVLQHDQSACGSRGAALVDEPCCAREPSARVRDFPAEQQGDTEPCRTQGRAVVITGASALEVLSLPGAIALDVASDQVRGDREEFEVVSSEGFVALQECVGGAPLLPGERLARAFDCVGHDSQCCTPDVAVFVDESAAHGPGVRW